MIKSFKHKGLKSYFETGSLKGIQSKHKVKLQNILLILNRMKYIEDANFPTFRLHQLKGDKKELWSITVIENWRITFKFENNDAYIVDYEDYH